MQLSNREKAVQYLESLATTQDPEFRRRVSERDAIQSEYGRVFGPANLSLLSVSDVKAFLEFGNARPWWGMFRQEKLLANMTTLAESLELVLDESQPIVDRLDWLTDEDSPQSMSAVVQQVITPILHFVAPTQYGIWSPVAKSAMHYLGLFPSLSTYPRFGDQYRVVNQALRTTAREVGVDLWTLDSLWWLSEKIRDPATVLAVGSKEASRKTSPSKTRTRAAVGATRTRARSRKPDSTFICENCFGTKAEHLRSADTNLCIDCTQR